MTDEESFNALFKSEQNDKSLFEEFEEMPDAEEISKSLKKEEQTEDIKAFRQNLVTVLDQAADSFKNLSKEEEAEEEKAESKSEEAEIKPESTEEEDEEGMDLFVAEEPEESQEELIGDDESDSEEKPMWQQFLRPDQMEVMMGKKEDKEQELVVEEDAFVDDIIEEDAGSMEDEQERMPEIDEFLSAREDFYVKEIFKGSAKKYDKALKKIQKIEEWEKAADYIHKNIFTAHKIDMFSEPAIEFTDRLQAYFTEYKN